MLWWNIVYGICVANNTWCDRLGGPVSSSSALLLLPSFRCAGGGGSGNGGDGGNGGSGVVILRMATSDYSGTTSGSPNVSTSGSDTILRYNSSGSYTG